MVRQHDLLIVGAGPVGLALALALKDSGLDIALVDMRDRNAAASDPRTLAFSYGTRLTLERLGVWHAIPTTPIESIHISQQGGFGRTLLHASDFDLPALGYVGAAGALAQALHKALENTKITFLDHTKAGTIITDSEQASITLRRAGETATEQCHARLLACAEGGLQDDTPGVVGHDYHQHALIAFVDAPGGHCSTAFERFTANGPVALLPCGKQYALVHVVVPEQVAPLQALDEASYLQQLQGYFGSRVQLSGVSGRLCYPLGLRYRRNPTGQRSVWLGNAAQTLHPVAGQGFNLALRDVWGLAERLNNAPGCDPGAAQILTSYANARRLDRCATIHFTDSLVRLFSNDIAPLRHLRGAGLFAIDQLPFLRHFLARRMMFGARAWP